MHLGSLQTGHLDQNAIQLLGIFSCIGNGLPANFFERAHNSLIWGSDGQPLCPGTGAPEDHERILRLLIEFGLVIPLPNNGGDTIMIHPEVPRLLSSFSSDDERNEWKLLAINAVLHAYPKDAQLSPVEYARDFQANEYC
ncbi:uncharacterized protein N7483_002452 [Penicillium malachiteum]|uniref:uncharacterized protein n=1 Tax=Penicillium malachiteum TaxID=1324776 RepID=UPI0025494A49|nr:uncharacterized protein N7483_002452 [Penicillium malachiteum]KAJ5737327.1 hypothetical protein N7483_002452 [Penicillium malachiteum]